MSRIDGPDGVDVHAPLDEVVALRQELSAAKRQALVGRLAGALAHDFNNVLTAVLGFAEMLLSDAEADHPWRADLQEIFASGQRAALLTRRLLAFNRQAGASPQLLSLNGLVAELEPLLRALIGEAVALDLECDPKDADIEVMVDKGVASEVLFTLGWVARTAVARGRCRLGVTGVVLPKDGDSRRGLQEIRFELSSDAGAMAAGAEEEVAGALRQLERVVAQAEGAFSTERTPASIRVVAAFPVEAGAPVVSPATSTSGRPSGIRAVLAEDEELLRQVVSRMLERSGITVVQTANGEEALGQFERPVSSFDLLVTDIVMPGMNGIELAERVLARHPGTRVLYVSGYIDAASIDLAKPGVRATFLPKPFTRDQLLAAVNGLFA